MAVFRYSECKLDTVTSPWKRSKRSRRELEKELAETTSCRIPFHSVFPRVSYIFLRYCGGRNFGKGQYSSYSSWMWNVPSKLIAGKKKDLITRRMCDDSRIAVSVILKTHRKSKLPKFDVKSLRRASFLDLPNALYGTANCAVGVVNKINKHQRSPLCLQVAVGSVKKIINRGKTEEGKTREEERERRHRLHFGTWHAYLKQAPGHVPRESPVCQVTWPCVKGLRFSSPDFPWRALTDRLAKSDWYSSATGFALIMRYYSVIAPLRTRSGFNAFLKGDQTLYSAYERLDNRSSCNATQYRRSFRTKQLAGRRFERQLLYREGIEARLRARTFSIGSPSRSQDAAEDNIIPARRSLRSRLVAETWWNSKISKGSRQYPGKSSDTFLKFEATSRYDIQFIAVSLLDTAPESFYDFNLRVLSSLTLMRLAI